MGSTFSEQSNSLREQRKSICGRVRRHGEGRHEEDNYEAVMENMLKGCADVENLDVTFTLLGARRRNRGAFVYQEGGRAGDAWLAEEL